jgi:hypothetical protein
MADEADLSDKHVEALSANGVQAAAIAAANIPKGEPGDCDLCGEWCGRLVGGACARCRDRFKLP